MPPHPRCCTLPPDIAPIASLGQLPDGPDIHNSLVAAAPHRGVPSAGADEPETFHCNHDGEPPGIGWLGGQPKLEFHHLSARRGLPHHVTSQSAPPPKPMHPSSIHVDEPKTQNTKYRTSKPTPCLGSVPREVLRGSTWRAFRSAKKQGFPWARGLCATWGENLGDMCSSDV